MRSLGSHDTFERLCRFDVKNTSSEVIPPFACMELSYTLDSNKRAIEVDGSLLVVNVKKPTATNLSNSERFLFNGPMSIAVDGIGSGYKLPIMQGLLDHTTPPEPGMSVGPKDGSWFLTKGAGGWVVKSLDPGESYVDDSDPNIKTVFIESIGGTSIMHVYPPSGGIPAASWNSTAFKLTPAKAACRIAKQVSGVYERQTETVMVENPVTSVVGASGKLMTIGKNSSGAWTVLVEDCTGTTTTTTTGTSSGTGSGVGGTGGTGTAI